MALTNADKQKQKQRYRIRHYGTQSETGYVEGFDIPHRLQTNIISLPNANLKCLVKKTGMTKRQIIEKAINELAERLQCNCKD